MAKLRIVAEGNASRVARACYPQTWSIKIGKNVVGSVYTRDGFFRICIQKTSTDKVNNPGGWYNATIVAKFDTIGEVKAYVSENNDKIVAGIHPASLSGER